MLCPRRGHLPFPRTAMIHHDLCWGHSSKLGLDGATVSFSFARS